MDAILAVVLGVLFGFVLHRVGASNPQIIIDMLRLRDLRLMKAILLGIGLGSALLFLGLAVGLIDPGHLSVKGSFLGVIVGGVFLGAGWALSGFCPGTGVVALGDGRRDAVAFVLGGLAGAFAYMLAYPAAKASGLLAPIAGGKATVAQTGEYDALLSGLPGWIPALGRAAAFIAVALLLPPTLPGSGASPMRGGRTAGGAA